MKRYSILWWLIIVPTSLLVGLPVFFLIGHVTDLDIVVRLVIASIATIAADLAIAASMEAVAPTKLKIGPGERVLKSDIPAEEATIVHGFDSSPPGQVSVRGETWMATSLSDDSEDLSAGKRVFVVDRDGLNLIVSSNPR